MIRCSFNVSVVHTGQTVRDVPVTFSATCRIGGIHAKIWDAEFELLATNTQGSAESKRMEMRE